MTYNKCPHPQCNEQKAVILYACKKHWSELSANIRYKIYHGFREDKKMWLEGHKLAQKFWGVADEHESRKNGGN